MSQISLVPEQPTRRTSWRSHVVTHCVFRYWVVYHYESRATLNENQVPHSPTKYPALESMNLLHDNKLCRVKDAKHILHHSDLEQKSNFVLRKTVQRSRLDSRRTARVPPIVLQNLERFHNHWNGSLRLEIIIHPSCKLKSKLVASNGTFMAESLLSHSFIRY